MPIRQRDGKWHYRFWVDGREYSSNTGLAATERNRIAATRKEAKARELVVSGRAHELKLEVKPFSDAAAEFLQWADGEYEKQNSSSRLRTSFVSLAQFFRTMPVSAILRGHVNDYKSWRRTEHQVRGITIRHDLHALSKAYGYFIDHNWARENPVRGVDIPSDKDAVRIHVLTDEEEKLYFERAAKRSPALHDLGRLMLNQGCRPEEILALRTEDFDLEKTLLIIRDGKSRAARRQLKLMAESLRICARRSAAGTPWLFPGKLPGTHTAKVNGAHDRVLDDLAVCKCTHRAHEHVKGKCPCGCDEFREASRVAFVIYDFRHTFATRAAESGMPVATLAKILGHADLRSVMKYVHVRQEAQESAMTAFEDSTLKRIEAAGPVPIKKPASREVAPGGEKERVN